MDLSECSGGESSAESSDCGATGGDDNADTQSSSTPKKVQGVWWLSRGKCYQAKRKEVDADGVDTIKYKRFKPSDHSTIALCEAHERARCWARGDD